MHVFFKDTPFQLQFEYELSYIVIPLSIILYLFIPETRPSLIYHMIIIGIIGTLDTLYKFGKYNGYIATSLSVLFHLCILFVLYDYNKYSYNLYSLLLLVLANIIIIYLPYWPYKFNKSIILSMYNIIYLLLVLQKYYTN